MKLSQCTYGVMVIDKDMNVGHVIGVTYSIRLQHTGDLSEQEKFDRTIPLVQFADGTRGIHHANIDIFKELKND